MVNFLTISDAHGCHQCSDSDMILVRRLIRAYGTVDSSLVWDRPCAADDRGRPLPAVHRSPPLARGILRTSDAIEPVARFDQKFLITAHILLCKVPSKHETPSSKSPRQMKP